MDNAFTCIWAITNVAIVEHLMLESEFRRNLKLMARLTDDMFTIWETFQNHQNDWKDFKLCVNQASQLNWIFECLGEEVVLQMCKFG